MCGIGTHVQNFADLWCSTVWHGDEQATYTSTVAPYMRPERRLIYEVFGLLGMHISSASRTTFKMNYVVSIRKRITIDIRMKVLESNMHDCSATTADDILTSLNLVLNNAPATGVDPTEEMDIDDVNDLHSMVEFDDDGEDLEVIMPTIADDAVATDEDDVLPDLAEK